MIPFACKWRDDDVAWEQYPYDGHVMGFAPRVEHGTHKTFAIIAHVSKRDAEAKSDRLSLTAVDIADVKFTVPMPEMADFMAWFEMKERMLSK